MLEGAPNFRDLGGYPAEEGRKVAFGRVFRSECFDQVTEADVVTIEGIGLRIVCDLRSAEERAAAGWHWPVRPKPLVLNMDVNPGAIGHAAFARMIEADPTTSGARIAMCNVYKLMPAAFAPHLANFFATLMVPDNLPAVFHCHAGKDRTGFLAAVLLTALDVPLASILEDFCRTDKVKNTESLRRYFLGRFAVNSSLKLDEEVASAFLAAHPDYLLAALDTISQDYGSMASYLKKVGNLDDRGYAQLKQALLD